MSPSPFPFLLCSPLVRSVVTDTKLRRFERDVVPYTRNRLRDVDWETEPAYIKAIFKTKLTERQVKAHLASLNDGQLDSVMAFALQYHAEEEAYWTFVHLISMDPFPRAAVSSWMDASPNFVFALLQVHLPTDEGALPHITRSLLRTILRNVVRSANELGVASLVALEKVAADIHQLPLDHYFDLLWLTAMSVRSQQLVQEMLLVLNDARTSSSTEVTPVQKYGDKNVLGIAFDRAEEAADECPCNDEGKPRRQRTPPVQTKLVLDPETESHVKGTIRIDAPTQIRLHSHVRLQAASREESLGLAPPILDGLVVGGQKGEVVVDLLHPPPVELARMDWNMYHAGSIGKQTS